MGKSRIVIVGGSFGGLTVAHELRRLLPPQERDITLVAKEDRFVFIPSLPWVAIGRETVEHISFPLARSLRSSGISFVHGEVGRIDLGAQQVFVGEESLPYDFLVIATGHRSANEAVPGLGPFDGPGHSLMSPKETEEARDAWGRFLENPGPVVVGSAPGASCLGPAYEFAFEIDHLLKRRRMRHQVPITSSPRSPSSGTSASVAWARRASSWKGSSSSATFAT